MHASWSLQWLHPAFVCVYDATTNALVISVRGTLSVEDCITDAAAVPKCLEREFAAERYAAWLQEHVPEAEGGASPRGVGVPAEARVTAHWWAHEGMWTAAKSVLEHLLHVQVLRSTTTGGYALSSHIPVGVAAALTGSTVGGGPSGSPRIMVVGHSLGAGVATLLSLMLKPSFPELQALAYSPPLALVSPPLAQALRPVLTSLTLGRDLVSRMSLTSMRRTFGMVRQLLPLATVSKTVLLRSNLAAALRRIGARWCGLHWCTPEEEEEVQAGWGVVRSVPTEEPPAGRVCGCDIAATDASRVFGGQWDAARELVLEDMHHHARDPHVQHDQEADPMAMPLLMGGRTLHIVPVGRQQQAQPPVAEEATAGRGLLGQEPLARPDTHTGDCCSKAVRTVYTCVWADSRDFALTGVAVSRHMVRDHFPDKVCDSLTAAWDLAAQVAASSSDHVREGGV